VVRCQSDAVAQRVIPDQPTSGSDPIQNVSQAVNAVNRERLRHSRRLCSRTAERHADGRYPALIALISLGIGAIIRHTAGAICAVAGVLFVLPLLFAPLSPSILNVAQNFLPTCWRRTR
jgi:hypothetical protein